MESGHQQWAPVLGERAFPAFAWIPAANADVRATPQARADGAGTCNKTSLTLGYFSGARGPAYQFTLRGPASMRWPHLARHSVKCV